MSLILRNELIDGNIGYAFANVIDNASLGFINYFKIQKFESRATILAILNKDIE